MNKRGFTPSVIAISRDLVRGLPLTYALLALVVLPACQNPQRPIFPALSPPIVWPAPPDTPRIRYIGALRGEADLDIRPRGWEAFRTVVAGPRPTGVFARPSAVAVRGERIFVADVGAGVVHLLDLEQRRYQVLRGAAADPLQVPIDAAIVGGDRLAVVDRSRAAVDLFDLEGNWLETLRRPELSAPTAAAWDTTEHVLWLADANAHACFATTNSLEISRRIGERGGAPGQFNFPTGLAVYPETGLVVADAMNFRVQTFGADGAPRLVFGRKGDAAGDFALPRDVAVDSAGHIYVLDSQFENVQIFDKQGRLLMAFGGGGNGPGEFSLPSGITIDEKDRIWIADSYNQRVQAFQFLTEVAP